MPPVLDLPPDEIISAIHDSITRVLNRIEIHYDETEFPNLFANGGMEDASGTAVIRQNLALNPIAALDTVGYGAAAGTGGVAGIARMTAQTGYSFGVSTSVRATWTTASTGGTGGVFYGGPLPGITAGKFYSFYCQAKTSFQQNIVLDVQWYTSADVFISSSVSVVYNPAAGGMFGMQVSNAQAPATATKCRLLVRNSVAGAAWVVGRWIEMSLVHVEETNLVISSGGDEDNIPVFGTHAAGTAGADYTYTWAGTAHASISQQRAPAPVGIVRFGTPIARFHQTTKEIQYGQAAMKILWDTGGIYTQAVGRTVTGLTVGQQYTAYARVKVPAGSPGVAMWNSSIAGTVYTPTVTTVFDEWTLVKLVFTATAVSHSFGVINNAAAVRGSDIAYVDEIWVQKGVGTLWKDSNEVAHSAGSISVDRTRAERRTFSGEISGMTADLIFHPDEFWYDKIIKVFRGAWAPSGAYWERQLGEFMVDTISDDEQGKLTVNCRDYTKKLMLSKFPVPTGFPINSQVEEVIRTIALNGGILKMNLVLTNKTLSQDYIFDRNTTRWEAISKLATDYGFDVYFNADGYLTLDEFADPFLDTPQYTFKTGTDGNIGKIQKSSNDSELFNKITVTGDIQGDTIPVVGIAENHEVTSPTRIEKIGERSYDYQSAFITDQTQADEVALNLLSIHALEQFDVNLDAITVPYLEAGIIAQFDDPQPASGDPNKYLLSGFTIPLTLGLMPVNIRRVTKVRP